MNKERRHLLYNFIQRSLFSKNYIKFKLLKSIKFNRNIENKKHIFYHFFKNNRKYSISKYKQICLFSGYKRAILNKLSSSRFIANKLAKQGFIHNYKP